MTEILGLPIHPLLVHLPVIVVPAFIIAVLLYVIIPPLRRRIGWLVVLLSFVSVAAVLGGWWSGHVFYDQHVDMISGAGADPALFKNLLADHLAAGDTLLWITIGLVPVTWLFALLERGRRAAAARSISPEATTAGDGETPAPPSAPADPAAKGRRVVMVLLAIIIFGLSGATGYYVFETGHSGAKVVWGTEKPQQ